MRSPRRWFALLLLLTPLSLGNGCPTGTSPIKSTFPHTIAWPEVLVNSGANSFPDALVVTDMNQDGLPDIVVGYSGGNGATAGIIVFVQVAPAEWGPVQIANGSSFAGLSSLAVGDIDGDGLPDIIAGCTGQIIYLHSPPNPLSGVAWQFSAIQGSTGVQGDWSQVAILQLDKLFGPDIVACNTNPGQLSWFRAPQIAINGSQWQRLDIDATTRNGAASFVLQDLDRDGNLDVISTASNESSASIAWYLNPGGNIPNATPWQKFPIGNLSGVTRLDIGDLNRDGTVDVVAISPSQQIVGWYAQPSDLLNSAWVGHQLTKYNSDTPTDLAVVDVDVNGQPDVVVSTADAGSLRWFTPVNDPTAGWVESNMSDLDSNVSRIALSDIDRTGRTDVVACLLGADATQDAVAWFRNPEP